MTLASCQICNTGNFPTRESHLNHTKSPIHTRNVQLLLKMVEEFRIVAKQYKKALYQLSESTTSRNGPQTLTECISCSHTHTSRDEKDTCLGEQLETFYQSKRPSKFTKKRRKLFICLIRELIRLCHYVCELHCPEEQVIQQLPALSLESRAHPLPDSLNLSICGSVALNLDTDSSDIDITANLSKDTLRWMHCIVSQLKSPLLKSELCLHARTPLVTLHDTLYHLQLDVAQSMRDMTLNRNMLRGCMQQEQNLKYLIFSIKCFAKQEGLNCSFTGTINSYGWTVLLLSYLQHENILPLLVGDTMNFDSGPQNLIDTTEKIGKLFRGFFIHYSQFDWEKNRISLRHKSGNTEKEGHRFHDNTVLCIERPFEAYSNNARQVNQKTLRVICRRVLKMANQFNDEHCKDTTTKHVK